MAMKKQKTKRNQVMLGALTASMAITPFTASALEVTMNDKQEVKHEVALTGTNMEGQLVKPNQTLELNVDKNSDTFKSIRQQLEKQSYGVLLVADNGEKIFLEAEQDGLSYNKQDGVITISNHPDFDRFTTYVATVLVKSEYQQALKGNLPTFTKGNAVSFQTGSAIGEAVNVLASLEKESVRVTETNYLNVKVTDSYGEPATDATLKVTGEGTGNARVESTFEAPEDIVITNGEAQVTLNDHSANTVQLSYEVKDNQHQDAVNSHSGSHAVEFKPGKTDKVVGFTKPSKIVAGQTHPFSGVAVDTYGNAVENGTAINATLNGKTVEATTTDGSFSLNMNVPTKAGNYTFAMKDEEAGIDTTETITVGNATANKVVISLPSTVTSGQNVSVSGSVQDQYGNLVPNQSVTVSGSLSGTLTTNGSGQFSGTLKANSTGSVTATAGGNSVKLTNTSGSAITSVSVKSSSSGGSSSGSYGTPNSMTFDASSSYGSSAVRFTGTVYDSSGSPARYADVFIYINGSIWDSYRTNAYGKLDVTEYLANGSYNIKAVAYTNSATITMTDYVSVYSRY